MVINLCSLSPVKKNSQEPYSSYFKHINQYSDQKYQNRSGLKHQQLLVALEVLNGNPLNLFFYEKKEIKMT